MLMSWRKCSRDMTRTEFEHISVLIRGRIVALARRFARAADLPDPAEDIAQETLEALWRLCEKGYPVGCQGKALCHSQQDTAAVYGDAEREGNVP